MRRKKEKGMQLPNAIKASEFTFKFRFGYFGCVLNKDGRTIKFYMRNYSMGCYCFYMDTFSGQIKVFKVFHPKFNDNLCGEYHPERRVKHSPIISIKFEQFGESLSGLALYNVCQKGVFISTACLAASTIQINLKNEVLLLEDNHFRLDQLHLLDDNIGLIVTRSANLSVTHFTTFRYSTADDANKKPIEIIRRCYTHNTDSRHFIGNIKDGYFYFFNSSEPFVFDYKKCNLEIKEKVIPPLKNGSQGAWLEDKFYFLHTQGLYGDRYAFGVYDLATNEYLELKLPVNIPNEYRSWFDDSDRGDYNPFLFINERGVLSLMLMDVPKEIARSMKSIDDTYPKQIIHFRIPLRAPETLCNLAYFSLLNHPNANLQHFRPLINNFYPPLFDF